MAATFRVGLLGHGTVGTAFAGLLAERADAIVPITGMRPEVTGILTTSQGSFEEVLEDADLLVELIGGIERVFDPVPRIVVEPGRSLVGNAGVTAYTVGTVKEIPEVRTYVAVDGGMSDNMRPMLYGSRYEAIIADRADQAPETTVTIAGMHCESSDVIVRDVHLHYPHPGDVLVTPATGAYGHAMANNYNGVPRPPVVFVANGDARVVVRRETYDDLAARDVD